MAERRFEIAAVQEEKKGKKLWWSKLFQHKGVSLLQHLLF